MHVLTDGRGDLYNVVLVSTAARREGKIVRPFQELMLEEYGIASDHQSGVRSRPAPPVSHTLGKGTPRKRGWTTAMIQYVYRYHILWIGTDIWLLYHLAQYHC